MQLRCKIQYPMKNQFTFCKGCATTELCLACWLFELLCSISYTHTLTQKQITSTKRGGNVFLRNQAVMAFRNIAGADGGNSFNTKTKFATLVAIR